MLDNLIQKVLTWNNAYTADPLHITIDPEDIYLWETESSGITAWKKNKAFFFSNNGLIYKLSNREPLSDWNFHCKLYDRVTRYNDCSIEIPVSYKIINLMGHQWLYTVVKRPFNTFGITFFEDSLNNIINTEYFLSLIDDHTTLLSHLKYVSKTYDFGLPKVIPKRVTYNQSLCWCDFKECRLNIDQYITKLISEIYCTLLASESTLECTLQKKLIIDTARKKWIK